jgi:polyhydroxyalkanoate synthase
LVARKPAAHDSKPAKAPTEARAKLKPAPPRKAAAPAKVVAKAAASPAAELKAAPMRKPGPKPVAKVARSKPAAAKADNSPSPAAEAPRAHKAAPLPIDPIATLDAGQRQALETLSLNLAKASLTAQGALTEAMMKRGEAPSADPFHVGPALTEVMGKLAMNPERIMRAQADLFGQYMDLWTQSARRAAGEAPEPVASPAKGDKRFNDPDWSANPLFDMMKQSYLVTSNWLNSLIAEVQDVDPIAKRRVEFFTKMLTDAFSPSNFLISNPAALREAVRSQGQSLVQGAQNFAADLQRGGGQLAISQTDSDKFKVGENIATAPGKVVYRGALFELLQFNPTTERVFEVPLLIFPPWINKYYILDLRPENSMIRWLTSQGFTVFVTSWVNPDRSLADKTLEDYMFGGIYEAVEQVLKQTGAKTLNAVGYCIGGTLLSCTLAHMAAKKDRRVASATFFAAQQDFAEAGDLLLFTNDEWVKDLEGRIDAAGGVSPSTAMADTFNALRANDLIWSFFVNNYLMGKEPAAFDLLFWNSDQTRMPKALHLSYLTDFYKNNRLAKGELVLDNIKLDLHAVKIPIFVQSSKDDHIAPFPSVYRGAKLFGGPVTFMMAGSGHIAGVINAPAANKYQHWTNPDLPPTVDDWRAGAVEHPGSWWPDWSAWLSTRSGGKVPARDPAKGALTPVEAAPGSYVKVRSTA